MLRNSKATRWMTVLAASALFAWSMGAGSLGLADDAAKAKCCKCAHCACPADTAKCGKDCCGKDAKCADKCCTAEGCKDTCGKTDHSCCKKE